jgi:hypothetical protein
VTRKLALILTTATACGVMPQIAAASCSGSACYSYSFASNKFTNKDKDLKIHLTGCILKGDGSCGGSGADFDITIDPSSSKPVPAPSSSTGDVKVDVKTAAFVGALQQPHVQTLPSTNSVMTTINNQTDVPVTVKYRDVESSEYTKEVKEHSSSSFAIRMATNWSANPVKWSAYADSKMCDSGTVAGSSGSTGTIEVTKCKKTCELSMDKSGCELQRDMKDTEQTRKRRDQERTDLASARSDFNSCVATAKMNPIKVALLDVCASAREKVNQLIAKITADDQKLGETEPGGPLRTEAVLNLTPIPAKPDDGPKVPIVHGCKPSGSPDIPKDTQGHAGDVVSGKPGDTVTAKAAGCAFQTGLGGGR